MVTAGGDVSVVVGGAGGIGAATVRRLRARGDRVAVIDLPGDRLAAVAGEQAGVRAYPADVRDQVALQRVCGQVAADWGPIRYAFYAAGLTRRGEITELSLSDWSDVIDTHLVGAAYLCEAVLPRLCGTGAALVLSSSDYAVIGMRRGANYAAAKAAVYALTKSLALELAPAGIRVNAVGAGPIDTALLRQGRTAAEHEQLLAQLRAAVPMGRLGQSGEVADAVEFLLSDRSSYVTGQLLQPNGGQVMW